jgi:hypothetical protein
MEDFDTNVELKDISDFGINFNKQNRDKNTKDTQDAQDILDEVIKENEYLDLR